MKELPTEPDPREIAWTLLLDPSGKKPRKTWECPIETRRLAAEKKLVLFLGRLPGNVVLYATVPLESETWIPEPPMGVLEWCKKNGKIPPK